MLWIILINVATIWLFHHLLFQETITRGTRILAALITMGTLLVLPTLFLDFLPQLFTYFQLSNFIDLLFFPLQLDASPLGIPDFGYLTLMGFHLASGTYLDLMALVSHIMALTNLISWIVARLINTIFLIKNTFLTN